MGRCVLLVLALALLVPGEASSTSSRSAGGGWSSPVVFARQFQGCVPAKCLAFAQLAVNARGAALVAWRHYLPSSSPGSPSRLDYQFAFRKAGRGFGAPQALPCNDTCSVALSSTGDMIAAWTAPQNGRSVVLSQVRSASGVWQHGARVSPQNENADHPQVAVAGSHGAIVAWISVGPTYGLEAAAQRSGGRFGAAQTLVSGGIGPPFFNLATDIRGDAIVGWSASSPGRETAAVRIRSADGHWQPTHVLARTATGSPSTPAVALDPKGDAIAVWSVYVPGKTSVAWSAFAPAGRPFGPAQRVGGAGSVSFDARGEALLTWTGSAATRGVADAALRSSRGIWQPTQTVSAPATMAGSVASAISPAGEAILVWETGTGTTQAIQAAARPPGGSFSAPQVISPPGFLAGSTLAVATDATGHAVAVWDDVSGTVEAATYAP